MARLACGFSPDGLEAPLAALDRLPRELWLQGIVNSVGRLPARLEGVAELREHLVAGRLPDPGTWRWPVDGVLAAIVPCLAELGLVRYCVQNQAVADQVVKSLLWHTDRIIDYHDQHSEAEAIARAVAAFREDWGERTGEMDEIVWVFGELGDLIKNDRWDLLRGLLKSAGWKNMLRVRKLLEDLPELTRVIRRLGRARQTEEPDEDHRVEAEVLEQLTALTPERRELQIPHMPAETCGVLRSGDIARMLPCESVLLTHPRLRLVWFARQMERILLTYEDRDVMTETVLTQTPVWLHKPTPRPDRRLEMGPMIVCVDTSGSMAGACEDVAKACVLEALRTARAQQRRCYVFAFGGPGEVVGRELGTGVEGIEATLEFLDQSFHGGTDICEPLDRALGCLAEDGWQMADLLVASDGEFGATPEVLARVRTAKAQQGLRIQGILIGDRETIGMLDICDGIHWVRDWRRFGPGGASPVHSKSLTAEYFPGAIHSVEQPQTLSANEASAWVTGRNKKE